MHEPFPKEPIREALRNSLPGIDPGPTASARIPFTYVPANHARALDPDNVLVEGIRGAGKSFWWNALKQTDHRQFVADAFPETRLRNSDEVGLGYGETPDNAHFPSKDVIAQLVGSHEPRHMWRAVLACNLKFPAPFPQTGKWEERVAWVAKNPEDFDESMVAADRGFVGRDVQCLILFDALDRLATDWASLRPIAKALFQVALDMRSCRAIHLKLFVRPDMLADRDIMAFPDASKLLGQKVSLAWRRADLYALVFQCLANDPHHGDAFRSHVYKVTKLDWTRHGNNGAWLLPKQIRMDEDMQRNIFHAIVGPTMASGPSGHKRGFPYTWLPTHLVDGSDQVSPRSFTAALRIAAETEVPESWPYPLHYAGLKAGVQRASTIRVNEIREDFPWVDDVMKPLRDLVVPCHPEELTKQWEASVILKVLREKQPDKLPPQHLDEELGGLLKDLRSVGIIDFLNDGRIQMPDVYRIAFGLGRKGGVRPVK